MKAENLKIKSIFGLPNNNDLTQLLNLYKTIFEVNTNDYFVDRIQNQTDLVFLIAYKEEIPVGFKIGYKQNSNTFYSWLGGVLPAYRQQGIAKVLAEHQEAIVLKKGYQKIATKSMNQYKAMLIFNLKNGFDITNFYTNELGEQKIVFEKKL